MNELRPPRFNKRTKRPLVEQIPSSPKIIWQHLLLPVALYLVLAALYLLAIPLGESPDEPGHIQCIEQVALDGRLPSTNPPASGEKWWHRQTILSGYMCYHMPLYYLFAGTVWWVTDTAVDHPFPATNPQFEHQKALFLHSPYHLGQFSEPASLLILRLFSILFGLSLVVGSYLLTQRLFPNQPLFATLAATFAAGWPQLLFYGRAISNDTLATALAVMVLLQLFNLARPYRFVWLTLLGTLTVFTKMSVAFIILPIMIWWGIEFYLYPQQRRAYGQALLLSALIALPALFLLLSHPLLKQHLAISSGAFSAVSAQIFDWTYWQQMLMLSLSSGWARFGWMNLPAPQWHANLWWLFVGAASLAGGWLFWRQASSRTQRLWLLISLLWLLAALFSYGRININRLQPQFRFLLALVPVLTSLTAVGSLYAIRQRPWAQWMVIVGFATLLLLYNLWFIFTAVRQAYPWYI